MGELEQLVLYAVVQLGDDACGVEIRETIEGRSGRVVSAGAIYTTLGRLERRGLVRSAVEDGKGPGPGRPRKHYWMTPAGARNLMATHGRLEAMASDVLPAISKLAEH